MNKVLQLQRAKRQALFWLCGAAAIFLVAIILQVRFPALGNPKLIEFIKMASEAALVGGLADWFAVTALFKPIPPKWPIPHTNIVASNKSAIANNLSEFVKDKFFHPQAIESLIKQSQPAQGIGRWLSKVENARRVSVYAGDFLVGIVNVIDDNPVHDMMINGLKRGIRKLDLAPIAAGTLAVFTKEKRHQEILDQLIGKLAELTAKQETQGFIAEKLSLWLKTEHRRLEKILPSAWLSEQGAQIAVQAIASIIQDIHEDPAHPVREAFDRYIEDYVERIQHDEAMTAKLNGIRENILNNDVLLRYLTQIWGDVKQWLITDMEKDNGKFVSHLSSAFSEIGQKLTGNGELANALNLHLAEAGRYMAPDLSDFLTRHIRNTIENWDEQDMALQIELNIGKDLQKVRINGTLVGGLIGALLYLIQQGIVWL
ncbi:DUF445 family protein [Alteromonas pelagimontana]|uniref:DUF445 family protein n=1 Tax=Alteromonas pelagimontana TaxID=1858656 RepID=A0A6M4M999_9ALTE|nr:DUF445 family protein [Alteromonas pelagimontana]QJR79751.1 DUF445 family protein [Alteromonas pelagimontana]